MKTKLYCLMTPLLIASLPLFADNEVFDGQDVSRKNFSYSASLSWSYVNSSWVGANAKRTIFSMVDQESDCPETNFSGANFTNANLTSAVFWGAILTGVNFTNANLTSAELMGATLTDVNFTNAIIKGAGFNWSKGFTEMQLKSTKSYQEKDLSGVQLAGNNFSGWDFSEQNLTSAGFYESDLTGVNFTNAIIKGSALVNTSGLTEAQLKSTKSYQEKDLSGIMFSGADNNFSGWSFVNQNLQNSSFYSMVIDRTDFTNADMRCPYVECNYGTPIYKNTIMTDGEIKNFAMGSVADNLTIRKYVPLQQGGKMINAKIVDDASISGGAVLTLNEGAILELSAGKTLTVSDGEIIFNVDAISNDTKLLLNSGSKLVFDSDSKITINLDGEISADDSYVFSVIQPASDSYTLGMDSIQKENITLNVNGEVYDADKWGIDYDPSTGELNINVNIPEPATCAALFGGLALTFALARRRK